jgi:hypothetical protein
MNVRIAIDLYDHEIEAHIELFLCTRSVAAL